MQSNLIAQNIKILQSEINTIAEKNVKLIAVSKKKPLAMIEQAFDLGINDFGENWIFNEGCLSIPNVREDVLRKNSVKIKYYDQQFHFHEEVYSGLAARIIQHEYDHLKGILFIDKLPQLKRQMIKGRLNKISKGKVETDYQMKFYKGR